MIESDSGCVVHLYRTHEESLTGTDPSLGRGIQGRGLRPTFREFRESSVGTRFGLIPASWTAQTLIEPV